MSLPDLQMDPAQRCGVRSYNVNQSARAVVVFGMSVWTPWSLVGVYAPQAWTQPARDAVTTVGIVVLAAWLTVGFRWWERPDLWQGGES